MAFTPKFVDLVRNVTTTTGTGNVVLGSAASGHVSLASAVAAGERFYYCILGVDKPGEREVGRGTMMANGTIAREPINGTPTNFSSGTKTISLVAAADWFRTLSQMINGGSDSLAALATSDKTSLLAAVNEVSNAAASAAAAAAAASAGPAELLFSQAAGSVVAASKKIVLTTGHGTAGEGGARYIFDAAVNAAHVTANPRTAFLAADGRGFRLDPAQHLTIEMFGALAGGTMAANGANNLAAILAAIAFRPIPTVNFTPTIHWGLGTYYCSGTINVHSVVKWIGSGNGANGSPVAGAHATRLITPVDVTTIINHNSNTTETGSQTANSMMAATGSIYVGMSFEQETQGTSATAYGFWMRGTAQLIQCAIRKTASHGIYMKCTAGGAGLLQGDCNNWVIDNCFVHTCGGDALHIEGQDANAGISTHLVTAGNTIDGCGIFDRAGLGNCHVNPQMTGYGNHGVWHLGSLYQLIDSAAGAGGATEPGTNANVWYPLKTNPAPIAGRFDQWVSGADYIVCLPLYIMGPSSVFGGYHEFGMVLAHCPGASAVVGAPFEFTNSSNVIKSWVSGSGLAARSGIGAYRGSGSQTTTPEYADEGAYSYTMLGTKDLVTGDIRKRPNILEHRTEQDGSASMAWHWSNKDQFLRYLNQKPIWSFGGPGTARTYGRDTPQPHYFTLHDFALQDATNSNNSRMMGLRAAAPATGNHAVGEFFFNVAPTATGTLGWSCTTAGTPGTWTAVPIAGFGGTFASDSTFGNVTIGSGIDGKRLKVENSTGYGFHAWMNAATTTLFLDNIKIGTGYSDINLRGNTLALWGGSATTPVQTLTIGATGVDIAGKMAATGAVTSNSQTAGVGYRTGAGGTVIQATSKTTGVTLARVAGQITLNAASLAAGASASFTLTNSAIAATDVVLVTIASGASIDSYETAVTATAAGSCRIQLRNVAATALAEAVVLNFAVMKGVAA